MQPKLITDNTWGLKQVARTLLAGLFSVIVGPSLSAQTLSFTNPNLATFTRPDLIVESAANGFENSTPTVFVTVKNKGNAATPAFFSSLRVVVGGIVVFAPIPQLYPGQSVRVKAPLSLPATGNTFIDADWFGQIAEANEFNNGFQGYIAGTSWF
jgi:hypothetical protein